MSFDPGLQFGAEIDNDRLCDIFKCSPQGGMRRSKQTNTLVIVSNHVESIYEDRWDASEVLHYTGMGRLGDQSLTRAQNKTLAESRSNGVDVFLFEVHKPRIYAFGGQVELTGEPYPETQPDEHGTQRRVWMFPLRLVGPSGPLVISAEDHRASQQRKAKHAQGLSDEELLLRAQHAQRSLADSASRPRSSPATRMSLNWQSATRTDVASSAVPPRRSKTRAEPLTWRRTTSSGSLAGDLTQSRTPLRSVRTATAGCMSSIWPTISPP
jgi:5-methylcytosine-specific restriction protein A